MAQRRTSSVGRPSGPVSHRARGYLWAAPAALVLGLLGSSTGCWSGDETYWDYGPGVKAENCKARKDVDGAMKSDASQGDTCTADCTTDCAGSVGTKVCRCEGGVFIQCPCLPPPDWAGPEIAPYCDKYTGAVSAISGAGCPGKVGVRCISEPNPSVGCECKLTPGVVDPTLMFPLWNCGAAPEGNDVATCESLGNGKVLDSSGVLLKGKPCPKQWDACVGRDYDINSETPRGCFCEKSPSGTLEWNCGSTNRWFRPADPTN